jgi:hypothetical protein
MTSAILSFLFLFTSIAAQPVTRTKEAALDQEFEIKIGKQVSIRDERLKVSFNYVAEDSRCPEGVQCIQAGNGKIVLSLSKAGKRSGKITLNTMRDPKHDAYREYDVKLVSLNPYPKKDVHIRKKEYVATLVVSRR